MYSSIKYMMLFKNENPLVRPDKKEKRKRPKRINKMLNPLVVQVIMDVWFATPPPTFNTEVLNTASRFPQKCSG